MSLFRENIDAMTGYEPGEQPDVGQKVVKLNTNENPYPPSPAAMEVLRSFDGECLRRYSDPMASDFCRAVGEALGVAKDWVLAGNGSDDLLTMIMRACAGPERSVVVFPTPTYVLYRTLAQIQNAKVVEIPYGENYEFPADKIIEANGAVIFIASPNSPSGTVVPMETLEHLAENLDGLLVIDEAYADFADQNAIELTRKYENVIILRTLSKGYSLAGLRLGFGIAQPCVLDGLVKVKDSYNVDAIACSVGTAAVKDQACKNANAEKVKASREELKRELETLGFKVLPSQANFLLARPAKGDAERIYTGLKAKGILVRYFKQPALEDKLRITVGTQQQNEALVKALKELV